VTGEEMFRSAEERAEAVRQATKRFHEVPLHAEDWLLERERLERVMGGRPFVTTEPHCAQPLVTRLVLVASLLALGAAVWVVVR
jgi:hypothetical protein